jgi:ribosomal subunit interface protein
VDIVVKGRHCEVSDRFRAHVEDKLVRLEKYNQRIIRVDVEVSQETNPRLSSEAVRIQITIRS